MCVSCFQDVAAELDQGILRERQCTQLLEQHEAAQAWLRERVKGLSAPPEDREGLHSAVNTLKVRIKNTQFHLTLSMDRYTYMSMCVKMDGWINHQHHHSNISLWLCDEHPTLFSCNGEHLFSIFTY